MTTSPMSDVRHLRGESTRQESTRGRGTAHLPMRCARLPKMVVPSMYETLQGRKARPCCHGDASMTHSIQSGRLGSSIAMPRFPNVIAPARPPHAHAYHVLVSSCSPQSSVRTGRHEDVLVGEQLAQARAALRLGVQAGLQRQELQTCGDGDESRSWHCTRTGVRAHRRRRA